MMGFTASAIERIRGAELSQEDGYEEDNLDGDAIE